LQGLGGLARVILNAEEDANFERTFRNLSFGHQGRPKEIIFHLALIRVQFAKRRLFCGFFEAGRVIQRRYFQGCGVFGVDPAFVVYWKRETGHFWQATTPPWNCLNTQKMGRTRASLAMIGAPRRRQFLQAH
jgi:hypothetical protein